MLHHVPWPVAGAFVVCTGAALLLRRRSPRTPDGWNDPTAAAMEHLI